MSLLHKTLSSVSRMFRNMGTVALTIAGFFLILFARTPHSMHMSQTLGDGVAHADAPSCGGGGDASYSCGGDSGSASGSGCGGGSCGGSDSG